MNKLSSERVLEETESTDSAAITVLMLSHRALSDVSCLSEFKNLEKLDLGSNNLCSLEGLSPCVNLKWLSVVQNKLDSLRGIEGLVKLTVLNAGKNKLKSMDEVRSLTSLRALILNDNEISSISGLDQMKELNTLVLSRNPIRDIGLSLTKLKSVTKLSLSECRLQKLGSSLKALVNLKEIRLAHNEISTLPVELNHNVEVRNLDLGNNGITRFSDLKVLASLCNLKNLNLHGNPVTEKDKLAKKIKKLVPGLQIFNARPVERSEKTGKTSQDIHFNRTSEPLDAAADFKMKEKVRGESLRGSKEVSRKHSSSVEHDNSPLDNAGKPAGSKALKRTKDSKKDAAMEKELKRKKQKVEQRKLDLVDDGETPFVELITANSTLDLEYGNKEIHQGIAQVMKLSSERVTFPAKKKKTSKNLIRGGSALELLSSTAEIGMGGPSTWGD
ncbi:hypothetical protein Scep_003372 [Stephania cephalantha]|uniref:Uncharacterized protein n=1 Tax=Stephania cephalantha TaxID=152367 RepID=A0AAP0KRV7_9MAGN